MQMFDYLYMPQDKFEQTVSYELDEKYTKDQIREVIETYQKNLFLDCDQWFDQVKLLGEPMGYCPNVKKNKKQPDQYKGSIADLCSIVRVAVTGHKNSPDLHTIMKILGEETVQKRLEHFLIQLKEV